MRKRNKKNNRKFFSEVEALDTIEAVDAFDYTSGYPEKLNFEVETENVEEVPSEPAGE